MPGARCPTDSFRPRTWGSLRRRFGGGAITAPGVETSRCRKRHALRFWRVLALGPAPGIEASRPYRVRLGAWRRTLPEGDVKLLRGAERLWRLRVVEWRVIFDRVGAENPIMLQSGTRG